MWWLYSFVNEISIMWCNSNFVVSHLQQWWFDTKATSDKNLYFDEGCLFMTDSTLEMYQEWEKKH